MVHVKMLASDHPSVPDKERLHDRIRVRILIVHRDSEDVFIFANSFGHFLLLRDLLYRS